MSKFLLGALVTLYLMIPSPIAQACESQTALMTQQIRVQIPKIAFIVKDGGCQQFALPGREQLQAWKEVYWLLHQEGSVFETPLAIAEIILQQQNRGEEDSWDYLFNHLAQPTSRISLLGTEGMEGESLSEHWVFTLQIPTMSDHLFLMIVPRQAGERGTIYGVN